jgi:MtrB/PioB family decaheme-associated outer membrane protein
MRSFSPLVLLGALGALSVAASSALAAVDTSQWKCETCPFEKEATSAVLDIGIGGAKGDTPKFGDHSGVYDKRFFLVAGGKLRHLGQGGMFGSVQASDLGLDTRALAAEIGSEGLYTLRFGYSEMPRHFAEGARTPFLGNGGSVLSLPAGFPAASTGAMPLGTTLQAVDIGYKRKRLEAGGTLPVGENWTYRVSLRHDVRDGTQRTAGSFFSSNASHLVAPVDQVTDQLEVSASYASRLWQATLAYHGSMFRNADQALTWANPFTPVVTGADRGQLALAPDNQFHQIVGSAGYQVNPWIRASGELAIGRMTQDDAYLAASLNTTGLSVPALPAQSARARANTFNGSVRVSATPIEPLRLNASYSRDERDNETPSLSYPAVQTDMFLGLTARSNQPFSFLQDRFKLSADYRGPGSLKTSAGVEQDNVERSLQDVATTRETTLWGRIGAQALDNVAVALKLAHAKRSNSGYARAAWVNPPQNPLLRKFNLAERSRDSAGLRADITISDGASVGLNADYANDDYTDSPIGLKDGRSISFGGDLSVAISEQTQLHLFAQGERIRSKQVGSQTFAQPNWTGRSKDGVDVFGAGIKHAALKGKLDVGADLVFSRSRSDIAVDTGASGGVLPTARTSMDSLKLHGTYQLQDNLSLLGSYWYESYRANDWRFDGVQPATLPDLLAFGEQAPRYNVNVVRVALRYRF